jgi:hypothetical protein
VEVAPGATISVPSGPLSTLGNLRATQTHYCSGTTYQEGKLCPCSGVRRYFGLHLNFLKNGYGKSSGKLTSQSLKPPPSATHPQHWALAVLAPNFCLSKCLTFMSTASCPFPVNSWSQFTTAHPLLQRFGLMSMVQPVCKFLLSGV